jgi:hypothetical protein
VTRRALVLLLLTPIGLVVVGALCAIVFSPAICRSASSYDACARLPMCSAVTTTGPHGPGWFCHPRFLSKR